jgi:ATP-dependent RNA helicase DDX47/RRP3
MADEGSKPKAAASAGSELEAEVAQKSFAELGLVESLCTACAELGWKAPTPILSAHPSGSP